MSLYHETQIQIKETSSQLGIEPRTQVSAAW